MEKADCFNCSSARRTCDRIRYRCETCLRHAETCSGYPRDLQWQTGVASRGKMKGKRLTSNPSDSQTAARQGLQIRFKEGRQKRKRKRIARPESAASDSPRAHVSRFRVNSHDIAADSPRHDNEEPISDFIPDVVDIPISWEDLPDFTFDDDAGATPASAPTLSISPPRTLQDEVDDEILYLDTVGFSPCISPFDQQQLTASFQVGELLNMYDAELCYLPLTFDFDANPFRCRRNTSHGSKFLLHSILALTMEHIGQIQGHPPDAQVVLQARAYKDSAVALYKPALEKAKNDSKLSFLDTTLILFTLELLNSAQGPWRSRLAKALDIFESSGGVHTMASSPRLQAQTAMFIWWDCTLALLSRTECLFPMPYYEFILQCDARDAWNMFSISGVPKDLFHHLVEIVQLAYEKEQTSKMRWATFNIQRVLQIEAEISTYRSGDLPPDDIYDDDSIHRWHDCHNGVVAWKYALLLYISRVFKCAGPPAQPPAAMTSFARLTLDAVRSCRESSMVQKQLLLPVFLAGSESNDPYARKYAQDYCESWYQKCRYRMFRDASVLMNEVWQKRDAGMGLVDVSWATIVDEKHGSRNIEARQYLFG